MPISISSYWHILILWNMLLCLMELYTWIYIRHSKWAKIEDLTGSAKTVGGLHWGLYIAGTSISPVTMVMYCNLLGGASFNCLPQGYCASMFLPTSW